MSKQTKIAGSKFGGSWTKQKLFVVEQYLERYAMVLKNTRTKKIYVDVFAGSGVTEIITQVEDNTANVSLYELFPELDDVGETQLTEMEILEGSALLSLKYDFDEFYFLEIDEERISTLESTIADKYPDKINRVHFVKGDSNTELTKILNRITVYDRCLMFLDPYALELKWETLSVIAKKEAIDLWYLFPLNALTRVLPKNATRMNANEELVSVLLGTDEWKTMLYETNCQASFLEEKQKTRIQFDKLIEYIIERFRTIFHAVSDDYIILKNNKRSLLFLLCFMMTNKYPKATTLANKLVKGIKARMEKTYGKN